MGLEELKLLYQKNAPQLDPEGFKLYRAAEDMTGFDLHGTFSYEDNRGMFEAANGHQLLRYLIAGHFHAVDWSIVPGTCYEAAALREVDTTTPEYKKFEQELYTKVLEKMGVITIETKIHEINKDTFWTLIAQAKEQCGQDLDASAAWLERRLMQLGPEQAKNFDDLAHGYIALADKYGLWSAASVMLDGCSDDGFLDFRAWLVAQGRDIYMAALKDPDTLADAPICGDGYFSSLAYIGDAAYEKLTGRSSYDSFDPAAYGKLKQELVKDIEYGCGMDYLYKWSEAVAFLPALCEKYLTSEEIVRRVQTRDDTWNYNNPDVRKARETARKGKKMGGREK